MKYNQILKRILFQFTITLNVRRRILQHISVLPIDLLFVMLGLTQVQLERLADPENVSVKTSRRDLQYVISQVWKHMLYLVLLSELG